jgi:hypothetical protein
MSEHYHGQRVRVTFWDGENVRFSGFVNLLEYICQSFSIPANNIIVESHDPDIVEFPSRVMLPGIFLGMSQHLPTVVHDYQRYTNGKFVGTLLGRSNPTRLRLAYEIDQAFPDDNFTVFQPSVAQIKLDYVSVLDLYSKEINWIENKKFDQDIQSRSPSGNIGWQDTLATYPDICNNYKIEIVSETDAFSNYWFTEKTGRCLAAGKPFILIAGTGSLAKLNDMGFKTFGSVIDEYYDRELTPTLRIRKAIDELLELYNRPDRDLAIADMYRIAKENVEIFKEYSNNQRENNDIKPIRI